MSFREAAWDKARAKELYEQDVEYKVIARELKTTVYAIKGVARRDGWRKRTYSTVVKWDHEAARKYYDAGMSYDTIAQCVGTSKGSISGFANRHWKKDKRLPAVPQVPVVAKRYARGERTLPKLPSIADLYAD